MKNTEHLNKCNANGTYVSTTYTICTIVFKKNGPTRSGSNVFLQEVHKSKLNASESNAMLKCLFRLIL